MNPLKLAMTRVFFNDKPILSVLASQHGSAAQDEVGLRLGRFRVRDGG
jgi:hypothetical protein